MNDQSQGVASIGAGSWGYNNHGSSDQIGFFDDDEGLRVWILRYGVVTSGRAKREEMDFTIPVEWVSSLIRALVKFAGDGEIARAAEREGYKS